MIPNLKNWADKSKFKTSPKAPVKTVKPGVEEDEETEDEGDESNPEVEPEEEEPGEPEEDEPKSQKTPKFNIKAFIKRKREMAKE